MNRRCNEQRSLWHKTEGLLQGELLEATFSRFRAHKCHDVIVESTHTRLTVAAVSMSVATTLLLAAMLCWSDLSTRFQLRRHSMASGNIAGHFIAFSSCPVMSVLLDAACRKSPGEVLTVNLCTGEVRDPGVRSDRNVWNGKIELTHLTLLILPEVGWI